MKKITVFSLFVSISLLFVFYPYSLNGQTLSERVQSGESYLKETVMPQVGIFTEADQYIQKITYHKEHHFEYMELSVEQIANSKIPTLKITSKDYLWKSYLALLDFPSGTPIRFYFREIALLDINDGIPLADYLIPVVINR